MPIKNSAIERIDIIVSKVLTQFTPYLTYRVPSTDAVINNLKQIKHIGSNDFLFSIDVVSMLPSIPTNKEALDDIKKFLLKHSKHIGLNLYGFTIDHIMEMIEFIFKNNYVENEGKFYRMDGGLMTGSHSAVIIGDIILNNAYLKAIDNNNTEPRGPAQTSRPRTQLPSG